MRFGVGSTLGPYEITGAIGAGGMGEVYRARDKRLGREVAIKVLPHELSRDPERVARFEREARSASALNHPGIITIHEFGSESGEAYLVMELVRGESLREIVARGALPRRQLYAIATGIADALAAAHGAGIVHRDLKPENVMVTPDGGPKILDFGLVKIRDVPDAATQSVTSAHVSHAGSVLGTASYMSPEQARGEAVDFRSDQFSFGLMLQEMATGRHPFRRSTQLETLAAILNDDPEPPDATLAEPFIWIIERCLAKAPAERYGSTADLARDLARLRDRSPSGTVRPLQGEQRLSPRTKRIAAAVGIILLSTLAFTLSAWRRTPPEMGDPIQLSVATPEIADVHAGEVAAPVVISPDGRYLAIYGADATGTNHLWLHDLRSGTTRVLADRAFAAGWSSDSRAIAYFAEGKLKTVSVDGGPARTVCDARPEGTPVWQGDTILYGQYSMKPGIYRVNAGGGTPEQVIAYEGDDPAKKRSFEWWPEFLPDGKHFLYLHLRPPQAPGQEIGQELYVGSLDGGASRHVGTIGSRAVFADGHLLFVREGTLLAQPFDPDAARFTGEARPILDGLHYVRTLGHAAFSVSGNGILAWRSARRPSRLAWFDRSGVETAPVARALVHGGGRLSPDGKKYAVGVVDPKLGTSDIWVYDLARGSQDRVTFQQLDERNPVWASADRIYYRSDGGGGPPDIFEITPGQDRREVLHRGPGVEEPHDVSRDGKWLLFISYTPPVGADILTLPLEPRGKPSAFATTQFQELFPRFSPDAKWVAYSSDVSGQPDVYVRPFVGSAGPIRISQAGGTRPRWSRDGKELFFLAPGGRLMAVPVGTDFGVPRMLFQAADAVDFDVSVDGTQFLVQLIERSEQPPLNVLVNWRARLQAQQ